MFDTNDYQLAVPARTLSTLIRYGAAGVPTGGFLRSVLSNDLIGAINKADESNLKALKMIVRFVCNEMPSGCHGNESKVKSWKGMDDENSRSEIECS